MTINPFGHLGDGSVHYKLLPPKGQRDFYNLENQFANKLARLAAAMVGSFAAEYGIGRAKIALADEIRDPVERNHMADVKNALDDSNLLNLGVLISS